VVRAIFNTSIGHENDERKEGEIKFI